MNLHSWRTPLQRRWMSEGGCAWETHPYTGGGSLQDLWPHWEKSPLCSRSAGRTCGGATLKQAVPAELDPVGGTHTRAVWGILYPHWRSSWGLFPAGGTPWWSRRRVRRGWSDRDKVMNWVQFPLPIHLHYWERVGRKFRSSWVWKKKEGWEQGVLRFGYYFSHYPTLIWLVINWFSWLKTLLPMAVICELSVPSLIVIHKPIVICSLPCPVGKTERQTSCGGHLQTGRVNQPHVLLAPKEEKRNWIFPEK